ncbi:hypothetical protein [Microbulbifer sp. ARAS458-1]|uniref:hypothetical protein n=1 Tax=Microbulbifer sp. ARAS458-1 TaxID=3140242 RepID=UPI003877A42A
MKMKLLKQFESEVDAKTLSERLRHKGILTHVSSLNSFRLSSYATGSLKVSVWVVLSSQENDAIALLANKKHKVSCPLTEEQMVALERKSKAAVGIYLNTGALYLLSGLLIGFLIWVAYSVLKYS